MKFARLLRETAEDLPELQCLFQDYKQLKKELKKLPSKEGSAGAEVDACSAQQASEDEAKFVQTLTDRIQLLNDRFLEREETCIIQLERLEAQAREATCPEQRAAVYKRFVDFHGEVLLLVHWSVLAYTATVKILKKHHKRTGLLVRAPHLANLLSQPFCSTEMMTSLARKAEGCIHKLAGELSCSATSEEGSVGPPGMSGVSCSAPATKQQQAVQGPESVASVQRVLGILGPGNATSSIAGENPESLQQLAQHVANMSDSDSDSEAHTFNDAAAGAPGSAGTDSQSGPVAQSGSLQQQTTVTETTTTSQPARPPVPNCDMLHKTRVALTMWEELKKNASTPSTVLDVERPEKRQRTDYDMVGSVGSEGSDCE